MNSKKYIQTKNQADSNLIGTFNHRQFLKLQAAYGFSQRGGVQLPYANEGHKRRLVSDVNILSSQENKQLIFSESIFSN